MDTMGAPNPLIRIVPAVPDGMFEGQFLSPEAFCDYTDDSLDGAINCTDDVRVFAGCLTGRRDWPVAPTDRVAGLRLAGAIAHTEVSVERVEDDPVRPRLHCRVRHHATHAPFRGFNRAQAAVLELAILVSRLDRLPAEKIDAELGYLAIAVEKTAGAREREAWEWLLAAVAAHRRREAYP